MTMGRGNNLAPGEGRGLIAFDADDTMWWTQELYDLATADGRALVEQAGFDGEEWVAAKNAIDVANVQHYGLSKLRFPTSCAQAYEQVAGDKVDVKVREAVRKAGEGVFTRKARLADGIEELLGNLSAEGWRLLMQTSGDREIQAQRISESGLADFFSEIIVVPKKSAESFHDMLARDGRSADKAWSVGNSLPSDINPALRAHWNAIWVPAHIWDHEKREMEAHQESGQLFHATKLSEIQGILQPELVLGMLLE